MTTTTSTSRPRSATSREVQGAVIALRVIQDRLYVPDILQIAEALNTPLVDLTRELCRDDDED